MKQKTRVMMAFFCGLFIAGNGWTLPFWSVSIGELEWPISVSKHDGKLIFVDDLHEEYRILPDSYYFIDSDGYSHFRLDEKSAYRGSKDIIIFPGVFDEYAFIEDGLIFANEHEMYDYVFSDDRFLRDIAKISSSPFLKETIGGKDITYEPENLFRRFLPLQPRESDREYWNALCVPWVEGDAGAGIGANITINFKEPMGMISLLNGYVDIAKKYLYRQNNRVKVLKVVDMDNNKEYQMEFEDMVYYNSLSFDSKTRNIKLVIMSVYPGTKYDDTCITQIRYWPRAYSSSEREKNFAGWLDKYKKLDPNSSSVLTF
jgi:hypothetical protein